IGLLAIQLTYGAFMAGLKAAPYAPTFPTINGEWIPEKLISHSLVNDPINVQFIHRLLAYLLCALVFFWFLYGSRKFGKGQKDWPLGLRWSPLILVLLQIVLGAFTVLSAPRMGTSRFGSYELLAQLHQLVA